MTTKVCFKCGLEKPIEEFYVHPQMGDGHLNKCKECTKKDVSDRYTSNEGRKKVREYNALRFKTKHRKAQVKEIDKRRKEKSPEKFKARQMVANYIRDGKLEKQPCEVCGSEKVEAHHVDYSQPLLIKWLCRKHHCEEHGKKYGD